MSKNMGEKYAPFHVLKIHLHQIWIDNESIFLMSNFTKSQSPDKHVASLRKFYLSIPVVEVKLTVTHSGDLFGE